MSGIVFWPGVGGRDAAALALQRRLTLKAISERLSVLPMMSVIVESSQSPRRALALKTRTELRTETAWRRVYYGTDYVQSKRHERT